MPDYNSLNLPAFGVTPIHKDILIEVDWIENKGPPNNTQPFTLTMGQEYINSFEARNVGTAADLRNPDDVPGIAVHIDSKGVLSYSTSSGSTLNDWGGSDMVPSIVGSVEVGSESYMAKERQGVFRYILLSTGWSISSTSGGPQWRTEVIYSSEKSTVASSIHESGHMFGLLHSGSADDTYDINCKPNYPSIMNYGFSEYGSSSYANIMFSKGILSALTPQSLVETNGMGDPSVYMAWLKGAPFYYSIIDDPSDPQYGAVNWNRDSNASGTPNDTSTPVKAFVHEPSQEKRCTALVNSGEEWYVEQGGNIMKAAATPNSSFKFNRLIYADIQTSGSKNRSPSIAVYSNHIHAVVTTSNTGYADSQVHFPQTDGIQNVILKDWNDWKVMADNLCLEIARVSFGQPSVLYGFGCQLCVKPGASCP